MESDLTFREMDGPDLEPWLADLGRLRIAVFREYPYLYDGDPAYEEEYLRVYVRSPRSRVVLLKHGDRVVGATTCLPLEDEGEEFRAPFRGAGIDPATVLYLGESVILREYRGAGAGREFFRRREAHAHRLGLPITAFCAVDRPDDHPARPAGYRPLHAFWERLGYRRRPDLRTTISWKEVGEPEESPKTLTFWLRPSA